MEFLLQTFLSYLQVYGYAALFAITFLAALALPIPAAATVIASAAFASQGYFQIGWVLTVAILGNVLGDSACYWIARGYGTPLLRKIGFRRIVDSKFFHALERRMIEHPGLLVFFTRFEVIGSITANFVAGVSNVPYWKYFSYEAAGEIVQVFMYSAIGYFFAEDWQTANTLIGQLSLALFIFVILLIAIFWKRIINWFLKAADIPASEVA